MGFGTSAWPSLWQYPEGTHGPHCGNIRRHPWPSLWHYPEGTMALIAAISGGHPWASLWHYPEGTNGPHCGNIRRASMALIVAISGWHPWPSLRQYPEGTHGPHCCHIRRALTSLHSCDIRRALPVSIPLRLQPATHLLSDSTLLVLVVLIPQNLPPLIMASPQCHDSPPPKDHSTGFPHFELEHCVSGFHLISIR